MSALSSPRIRFALSIVVIGALSAGIALVSLSGCSSTPKDTTTTEDTGPSLNEVRALFDKHWAKSGKNIKVMEIVEMDDGWFRGNGIVDQRPVEEFFDSTKRRFTRNRPNGKEQREVLQEVAYTDYVAKLGAAIAADLPESLADGARVAVVGFPSDKNRITALSQDLANKFEVALNRAGKRVVDRSTIQKVLDEQRFQQSESALFDATLLARIGKFAGASAVVHGTYSLLPNKHLTVTAKAVSVETGRILTVKQEDFPLTGAGAASRDEILQKAAE